MNKNIGHANRIYFDDLTDQRDNLGVLAASTVGVRLVGPGFRNFSYLVLVLWIGNIVPFTLR